MPSTSSVVTVKAAMVSLYSSQLPAAQVTYGRPMPSLSARKRVYVGDVDGSQSLPVHVGGRKVREEDYQIEVFVEAILARGTLQEAETEAFDMLDAVENVHADDPTLGGLDIVWAIPNGDFSVVTDWASEKGEGPVCLIRFEINVKTRLH